MNLNDKDTPEGKGLRTAIQAIGATVVAFFYGLWNLPGVPEYVNEFVQTRGVSLLFIVAAAVGIPAGLIAFFQNRLGR